MGDELILRCSWIPIMSRGDELLLRFQPHWGGVWYWPSVTDDGKFRDAPAFFDAVCADIGVERRAVFAARSPLRVSEFVSEVVHVPTGRPAVYQFRVVDLSHLSGELQPEFRGLVTDCRYRWLKIADVLTGQTGGEPIPPEVASLWRQTRG